MDAQRRDEIGEKLSAYLDGELTPTESAEVERLLDQDDEVRALMVELRQAADSVRELQHGVAPPGILAEIQQRVERQELLGPPDQPVTLSRHQKRPLRSVLATAAALIITVGGGLWAIQLLSDRDGQQHAAGPRSDALEEQRLLDRMPSSEEFFKRKASGERGVVGGDLEPAATAEIRDQLSAEPADNRVVFNEQSIRKNLGEKVVENKFGQMDAARAKERLTNLGYVSGSDSKVGDTKGEASSSRIEPSRVRPPKSELPTAPPPASQVLKSLPTEAREQAESKRPPLAPSATLEQKLERGAATASVLDHRFANEPMRLEIKLADARGVQSFAQRLQSVVESREQRRQSDVGVFVGGWREQEADNLSFDDEAGQLGLDHAIWVEGEPDHNFEVTRTGEVQYLVRVDAQSFAAILSAAKDADAGVVDRQLHVGRMRAESDTDIQRLAEMTLGRSIDAPSEGQASKNSPDTVEGERLPNLDIAKLLRRIGVAPPSINGPTQQVARTEIENEEKADVDRFAGRSDSKSTPPVDKQEQPRRRSVGHAGNPMQGKADAPALADELDAVRKKEAVKENELGLESGDASEPLYTIVIRLTAAPIPATPKPTATPTPTPTPQPTIQPVATPLLDDEVMFEMQSDSPDAP